MEQAKQTVSVARRCGSFEFRIEGFSALSKSEKEVVVSSKKFELCGNTWRLNITLNNRASDTRAVACHLTNMSESAIQAEVSFVVLARASSKQNDIRTRVTKLFFQPHSQVINTT